MNRSVPWKAVFGLHAALGAATTGLARDAEFVGPVSMDDSPPTVVAPDDPWSSPEVAAPRMEGRPLLRRRQSDASDTALDAAPARVTPWLRTTGSLVAVVGLIALLTWGYRIVIGRGGRLALSGRRTNLIEVVGRTTLSPRQSLCLVRLGPRLILLGVTNEAVRALDVINDADLTARLMGQTAQRHGDSHTAEFTQCLEREARAYETPEGKLEEAAAPEETQLADVRGRLSQTVQRLRARLAQV